MAALHYTVVSEKMLWIWYHDELGTKHLKELLAEEAAAFLKRVSDGKERSSVSTDNAGLTGMEFLK